MWLLKGIVHSKKGKSSWMYSQWIRFIIADLKKCGITSLAHQWILWMGAVRTGVWTAHKDTFLYTLHKTDGQESCGYSYAVIIQMAPIHCRPSIGEQVMLQVHFSICSDEEKITWPLSFSWQLKYLPSFTSHTSRSWRWRRLYCKNWRTPLMLIFPWSTCHRGCINPTLRTVENCY